MGLCFSCCCAEAIQEARYDFNTLKITVPCVNLSLRNYILSKTATVKKFGLSRTKTCMIKGFKDLETLLIHFVNEESGVGDVYEAEVKIHGSRQMKVSDEGLKNLLTEVQEKAINYLNKKFKDVIVDIVFEEKNNSPIPLAKMIKLPTKKGDQFTFTNFLQKAGFLAKNDGNHTKTDLDRLNERLDSLDTNNE